MATATVGIVFDVNEASLKAQMQGVSRLFVSEMGKLGSDIGAKTSQQMNAAMNGVAASATRATGTVKASYKDVQDAAERAAKATAAAEKRLGDLRTHYAKDAGKQIVADMKHLQDRKATIESAITREHDAEVKKRLRAEKSAVADEIRMRKQVAMEKEGVTSGGMGAKAGMMGTGRQMLGNMPGMGMLAGGPAAGVAAVGLAFQQVISIGAEFEDSLADMGAIIGSKGEELKRFGDIGREVGMKYGIDGKGGVEAMKLVISALGPAVAKDEAALKSMTNTTLQFAKAGGMEAADATDALTVSLGQYGFASASSAVQAEQMARMADIQSKAAQLGSAEIGDLAASIKVAGATASNAKMSYEETAAAIEMMAPAGIKGAEAGTALRNSILKMSSGTKEGTAALSKMGLTYADINPEKVGYTKALQVLNEKFKNIKDPVEKAAAMQSLFGMENSNAMKVLMASSGEMEKFTGELKNAGGATEEMAKQKMATFNEQMAKAMVQIKDVAISLFDALKPALDIVLSAIGPVIDALKIVIPIMIDMATWVQQLIVKFVTWAAGTKPVQDAMAWLSKAVQDVVAWAIKAWASIQVWADGMREKLQPAIAWVKGALQTVAEFIGKVFLAMIAKLTGYINDATKAFNWVVGAVGSVIDWFSRAGKSIMSLGGFFGTLLTPIKAVIGALGDVIGFAKDAVGWVGRITGISPGTPGTPGPGTPPPGTPGPGNIINRIGGVVSPPGTPPPPPPPGTPPPGTPPPDRRPKEKGETAEQKAARLFNAKKEAAEEVRAAELSRIEVLRTEGKMNDEQQKAAQLDAERVYLLELQSAATTHGQKLGQINRDIALNDAKIRRAGFESLREILQDEKNATQADIEQQMTDGLISDQEAKKLQVESEIVYLEKLRTLMTEHGQDTDAIQTQITTAKRNHKRLEFESQEVQLQQEHAARLDALEAEKEETMMVESEYLRKRAALYRQHESELTTLRRTLGVTGKYAEKNASKAGGMADKDEAAAEKSLQKEGEAARRDFEQTNIAYKSLMSSLGNITDQGLKWMDEGWQKSFSNKKTVLFQALQQMSSVLQGFLGDLTKSLLSSAATIIGQNAAIAASWMTSAAAAAFSWMAGLGPLGWIAGAATAIGIATQWDSIKKMFLAEGGVLTRPTFAPFGGGMAIAGEAGPEAVIPLAKLPAMVREIMPEAHGSAALAALASRPVETFTIIVASEMEAKIERARIERREGKL